MWNAVLPSHLYRSTSVRSRVVPLLVLAVGVALVVTAGAVAGDCRDLHLSIAFSGDAARVNPTGDACSASLARMRASYAVDIVAALVYGPALAAVLVSWWRYGWRSRRQGAYRVARAMGALALFGALLDVLENVTALAGLERASDGRIVVGELTARLGATFGTSKWVVLGVAALAALLTLYGAWRFHELRLWPLDGEDRPTPVPSESLSPDSDQHALATVQSDPAGVAVCLSGGGIRSAAFAWGAMAALQDDAERWRRIDRMYSVSGGGYAATSLTASTTIPELHFDITASAASGPPTTPFRFVRRYRRYLDNLRGGVGLAAVRAILFIGINLVVIFAGLVLLAIPMGLLARHHGVVATALPDGESPWDLLLPGAWAPVLYPLIGAGVAFAISWTLERERRRVALGAMGVCIGVSALVFVVRIVVPWFAVLLEDQFTRDWRSLAPPVVTWVGGVVLALFRSRLPKMAVRLGGVVSTVAMAYALILVVHWILVSDGRAGSWSLTAAGWGGVAAVATAFLIAIDLTGVQWWSLHPVYRDRLASTFVQRIGPHGEIRPQPFSSWKRWSDVSSVNRPKHVVCAATHRRERTVTGLSSVSYRFSCDGVDMFVPRVDASGAVTVDRFSETAEWLDRAVGADGAGGEPGGSLGRRVLRRNARSSVIAGAAMSGAAFNSAMGRESRGSTDSLLAVLNLRLGVWLPNHRFFTHGDTRFPKAGLRYLFHEVIGHFDVEDPFVHVSDGGHWENLGLVEAIRDRHSTIVVMDASGGAVEPASVGPLAQGFAGLNAAVDLARIELHSEVRLDVGPLRPDPLTGRSLTNWAAGVVVYHTSPKHDWRQCGCPAGRLLYLRSVISDRTPERVLAFANVDRTFPAYSTADQFLTDAQFTALVHLGNSAMTEALTHHPLV